MFHGICVTWGCSFIVRDGFVPMVSIHLRSWSQEKPWISPCKPSFFKPQCLGETPWTVSTEISIQTVSLSEQVTETSDKR